MSTISMVTRCCCSCCRCCSCCLSPFLSPVRLSLVPCPIRVSSTKLPPATCSAACLAAHQVLCRPLALRMCGPWSTRIYHAFRHHVMYLFDTWLPSCTEFVSSSCPPWAFTSLFDYSLLLFSLLMNLCFSFSRLLRSPLHLFSLLFSLFSPLLLLRLLVALLVRF